MVLVPVARGQAWEERVDKRRTAFSSDFKSMGFWVCSGQIAFFHFVYNESQRLTSYNLVFNHELN